ncbi:DUF2931 family protein [Cellulophaga sp. HaHa_2_1]|nr:DUF2931 family protein [Cellulophaga sp. HaHa_2_1]
MYPIPSSYEPIISHNGQSVVRSFIAEIKNEFIKEKKVRFIIRYIFFTISLLIIGCKDQKLTKLSEEIEEVSHMNKFEWRPTECAPKDYPIEIYEGDFITEDNNYFSLPSGGTINNGWGNIGSTWVTGPDYKPVPSKLKIIYISYTESQFYYGDFDLPKDQITALFEKGYINRQGNHENYDYLSVGLAPGGTVSVWIMGAGRYTEIGHYQGLKTDVTMEDFKPNATVNLEKYVLEEQDNFSEKTKKTIAKEGIPIGKWSKYRQRYNWKTIFKNNINLLSFRNKFYNGEFYNTIGDNPILNEYNEYPPCQDVSFYWSDKLGNKYGCQILFNEEEIWSAFEKTFKNPNTTEANLVFDIDKYNSSVNISLVSDNNTILIEKSNVKIYNSTD